MTPWSRPYIGLPYERGARGPRIIDCWGIVVATHRDVLGIAVPSYNDDYVCETEQSQIAAAIEGRASDHFVQIPIGEEQPFDVLVFWRGRFKDHVGLVVEPRRRFLHAIEGERSSIVWYDDGRWRRRLDSVWRHREMVARLS